MLNDTLAGKNRPKSRSDAGRKRPGQVFHRMRVFSLSGGAHRQLVGCNALQTGIGFLLRPIEGQANHSDQSDHNSHAAAGSSGRAERCAAPDSHAKRATSQSVRKKTHAHRRNFLFWLEELARSSVSNEVLLQVPHLGAGTKIASKLYRARSLLYRSRCLQSNIRLKALAEIYIL